MISYSPFEMKFAGGDFESGKSQVQSSVLFNVISMDRSAHKKNRTAYVPVKGIIITSCISMFNANLGLSDIFGVYCPLQ